MITLVIRFLLICALGGEKLIMVDVYVALIVNNRRTFTQIPSQLQPAVKAELEAIGLGTDGKPL